jgi:hypothetical protein
MCLPAGLHNALRFLSLTISRCCVHRFGFQVYVQQKLQTDDGPAPAWWRDVLRWEKATPQLFVASVVKDATAALTDASPVGTIQYIAPDTYKIVTSASVGSALDTNHFEAFVSAVYNDGTASDPETDDTAQASTIAHDLSVSGIDIVKADVGADSDSHLIITYSGPSIDLAGSDTEKRDYRKL